MFTTWVLVLMINASGDSSMTTIEGYSSKATCEAAGEMFDDLVWKQYHYCLEKK
jgi:hypothetical protein